MNHDFDSDFPLPRPTKIKFAKIAFGGAALVVSLVEILLGPALDSLKAALANVGISAPEFLSFPTILLVPIVLFALCFAGIYYAQIQIAQRHIDQFTS
jgi:hypothetical protein